VPVSFGIAKSSKIRSGTGFFRKLRNKPNFKDIPIIVISGLAGRNVAVSKNTPVFEKPFDKDKLLKKISEILKINIC
jgi:CheY-like chemotaxis protein